MSFDFRGGLFAVSVSVSAVTWAASAAADAPILKGSYGFTGTMACLVAPGHAGDPNGPQLPNPTPGVALPNSGFLPNLRPKDSVPSPAAPGSSQSYASSNAVEGIRKFNGDGTGTVKGTSVGVTVRPTPGPGGYPHFPPAAGSSDFSFSFTYTVNPDGSWTGAMVPGSYIENHITGPRAGQTGTVDAIPPVTGMISQDGKTLIAAHLAPRVETHTYSNGDVDPMICHRSRVFIKLSSGDDDASNQGGQNNQGNQGNQGDQGNQN
jgi:hypothetical protein